MKFLISLLLISFMTLSAFAQGEEKPVHFLLAAGSEFRPEKDAQGNFTDHIMRNMAIGSGYESFVLILERTQFVETSGNATLSIERKFEDHLLWLQTRTTSWYRMLPFAEAGVGIYQEKIKTQLSGIEALNESKPKLLGGVGFGLSLDIPLVWISLEARVLVGDEFDRQPTFGGLARAGIWF